MVNSFTVILLLRPGQAKTMQIADCRPQTADCTDNALGLPERSTLFFTLIFVFTLTFFGCFFDSHFFRVKLQIQ